MEKTSIYNDVNNLGRDSNYYEYKNLIFRGSEELGYENYGNGGRDPLEDENRDPRYKHFKE